MAIQGFETKEQGPLTSTPNGFDAPARMEQYREQAVDVLHGGADAARGLGRRTSKLGRRAGEGLDHAADWVEGYDMAQAPRALGSWLKRHPGAILTVVAGVFGFWLARSRRR